MSSPTHEKNLEKEYYKRKKKLWEPDKNGEFHLGDLMYNLEKIKSKRKKSKQKED